MKEKRKAGGGQREMEMRGAEKKGKMWTGQDKGATAEEEECMTRGEEERGRSMLTPALSL